MEINKHRRHSKVDGKLKAEKGTKKSSFMTEEILELVNEENTQIKINENMKK